MSEVVSSVLPELLSLARSCRSAVGFARFRDVGPPPLLPIRDRQQCFACISEESLTTPIPAPPLFPFSMFSILWRRLLL